MPADDDFWVCEYCGAPVPLRNSICADCAETLRPREARWDRRGEE